MSRNALGKGLGALIRETEAAARQPWQPAPQEPTEEAVQATLQEQLAPELSQEGANQLQGQQAQQPQLQELEEEQRPNQAAPSEGVAASQSRPGTAGTSAGGRTAVIPTGAAVSPAPGPAGPTSGTSNSPRAATPGAAARQSRMGATNLEGSAAAPSQVGRTGATNPSRDAGAAVSPAAVPVAPEAVGPASGARQSGQVAGASAASHSAGVAASPAYPATRVMANKSTVETPASAAGSAANESAAGGTAVPAANPARGAGLAGITAGQSAAAASRAREAGSAVAESVGASHLRAATPGSAGVGVSAGRSLAMGAAAELAANRLEHTAEVGRSQAQVAAGQSVGAGAPAAMTAGRGAAAESVGASHLRAATPGSAGVGSAAAESAGTAEVSAAVSPARGAGAGSAASPARGVTTGAGGSSAGAAAQIDIDLIDPNPYQPRTRFDDQALEELAQSIRSTGIIQPLVLRRKGARYQLIAGERRWRAGQRAGLHKVPAVLMDVPDEQALEITLVENIQREDLNPVEEANAYDRLMSEFLMTQEEVAVRTGKDRSTIANAVRLLRLEHGILNFIEEGKLTSGHARALLQVDDGIKRFALASRAVRRGMTVRQLERLAARVAGGKKGRPIPKEALLDPNTREALEELSRHLGTRVGIRPRSKLKAGALLIEFYDEEQLAGLYDKLLN